MPVSYAYPLDKHELRAIESLRRAEYLYGTQAAALRWYNFIERFRLRREIFAFLADRGVYPA